MEGLDWSPISIIDRQDLEAPFSPKEIRRAVFGFDRNKSPGSNDVSMAFHQDNWEVIKEDLMKMFWEFYPGGGN